MEAGPVTTVAEMLAPRTLTSAAPPPGFAPDTSPPPPPPGFAPEKKVGGLEDIGRGGLGGLIRGVAALPGFVGELEQGADEHRLAEYRTAQTHAAERFGRGEISAAERDRIIAVEQGNIDKAAHRSRAKTTDEYLDLAPQPVRAAADYRPQTEGGRLAASIGGFAPALIPGPGEVKAVSTVADLFKLAGRLTTRAAAGGTAAEGARAVTEASGGGPGAQTAASLIFGMLGYGGAAALTHPRAPVTAEAIAKTTPRELMLDEHGDLTPDGLEASIKHDIPAEKIKAAYAANPEEGAAHPSEAPAERVGATPGETAPVAPEGVAAALTPAPEAPAPQIEPSPASEPVPVQPKSATARIIEAQSLETPVPLSRGQALQDPVIQRTENDIKNISPTAGTKAEEFRQQQQAAIQQNVEGIKSAFGDVSLTPEARGEVLKDGIRGLEKQGAAGVSAKYQAARDIAGGATPLDHGGILDAADEVIIDRPSDEGTRKALETLLAKYGLTPGKIEVGDRLTIVKPKVGPAITIRGEVTPLNLDNAEEFRKGLNEIYRTSDREHGFVRSVIKALDRTVDEAIEAGASGEKNTALKAARASRQEHAKTFEAKDIVQRLADMKAGTQTDAVSAERGIREVLGSGPDDVRNLKRVKAVLLSKPTEASRAAWQAVQAQGVADIFARAIDPHGNISGAKLTSSVNRFGREKLKVLLDPADFNGLMKLERVTRNATVPLPGTINPSGSGYVAARFLTNFLGKLTKIPVLGYVGHLGVHAVGGAVKGVNAERSLAKMTGFGLKEATKAEARPADTADLYRNFVDVAGKGGLLTGALADMTSGASQTKGPTK